MVYRSLFAFRSRVWAEPCILTCAVSKLGGSVERWLNVAEGLFGPYVWGRSVFSVMSTLGLTPSLLSYIPALNRLALYRYDLVFLPPSFPIVAMENPCLTFIISSILESQEFLLIDVIHEIAHGWFGNAVTNATWEEMWLSEGLATYAQRRITTEAYGTHISHSPNIETCYHVGLLANVYIYIPQRFILVQNDASVMGMCYAPPNSKA